MGANAYEADRRTGEWMLQHKADFLGARVRELLAEYERESPEHTLRTFADVEDLWEEIVKPNLAGFDSMQDDMRSRGPVPENSVWYPNWRVPEKYS